MRRLMRPAIVPLLVAVMTLSAFSGDKAKSLYDKGQDAEARQNYEAAYDLFKQAYDLKPKELRYRSAFERTRFEAAAAIVHKGQQLRDDGKLDDAVAAFQKALSIDPSLFIAKQELIRTQKMISDLKNPTPQAAGPPAGLERKVHDAAGPVELAPISVVPITVKLTDKSDTVYRTIGQLAGINVLFDPDYTPKQIKVELNGVTLEEALEITALESKTFWRPVTPNTIFIATDNPAKRKELEQSVLKTFYLENLSQPTELQDVVNAIRAVLDVQRVQQLLSQNALVVRGTPDQIALAEKMVDDLDKARPEIIVDIAVLQVSKDKSRTLGMNWPTSATVALQSNINTTPTTTTAGTTSTASSTGGLELNTLGNLNATDFQVTISSGKPSGADGEGGHKMLQDPEVRALCNQKASLKIGERVPVATGSFQPGIGGVGINPLVNTQFQYLDVGVNIDITPRVHAGREISLKLSMDVSEVDSYVSIGGISQPVIGQRKIEHEIRLKDGEVSLLGGMMEDSRTKSLTGIPGLASIPILKYLFAQDTSDHSTNEIVFVLIPHIIRGPDTAHSSEDMLDVGTANAISLRRNNTKTDAPAGTVPTTGPAPATSSPGMAPQGAAIAVPPPAQQTLTSPGQPAPNPMSQAQLPPNQAFQRTAPTASGGTFLFDPPVLNQAKGSTFTVNVMLSGGQNVYSVPVQLNYDPNQLKVVDVSNGGFLSQDGQAVALVHRDDDKTGTLQITATRPPGSGGVSGQGAVVTLTFMAKEPGQSALTITRGGARDPAMQPLAMSGAQAAITIQ